MKTYTYKSSAYETGLQVGEPVDIEGSQVVVLTILEVDFNNETVLFCGFKTSELDKS